MTDPWEVVARLRPRFAARAAEVDRTGEFPVADFADLREARLFGLLVPESSTEGARSILAGYLTWNNQILVSTWLEKDWEPDDMDLSDFEVTVDDQFGEDYKVAVRLTVTGVDPHTRRQVKRSGIGIVHVADGSIGEHWIRL